MRHMGRRLDVELLVGASDIRERLGMARTQDVHTLRRRDPTFPEPVRILGGGPTRGIHVWYWPDVATWARRKGVKPETAGAAGRRRSQSARAQQAELVRMREELGELAELRSALGELSELRERVEILESPGGAPDGPTSASGVSG